METTVEGIRASFFFVDTVHLFDCMGTRYLIYKTFEFIILLNWHLLTGFAIIKSILIKPNVYSRYKRRGENPCKSTRFLSQTRSFILWISLTMFVEYLNLSSCSPFTRFSREALQIKLSFENHTNQSQELTFFLFLFISIQNVCTEYRVHDE